MQTKNDKSIYKQLLHIVAPISFQYLMASFVSASDAFMLGFLDQDSLAASSLATQIPFVYSLFYGAFVFGFNVLAAQYWGKGDKKSVEEILTIAMRYALLVGILFSVLTACIPGQIMRIFTADPVLIEKGAVYLRTVSLSFVLTGFTQIYYGLLKVCDHAGLSSMIGSLAVVLNIALNAVFIFGLVGMPAMGIAGAALATVCARIFETIAVIIVVTKYKCPKLGNMLVIKDRQMHKDYWKYTTPLLVNQIGWGGGVTMYSVIMGHMGSDATAANYCQHCAYDHCQSLLGNLSRRFHYHWADTGTEQAGGGKEDGR